MNLFNTGFFRLHSGLHTDFKIDCDALTDEDISTIALQLVRRLPIYGRVEGVPQGGLRLAAEMRKYEVMYRDTILIVDDVFTTGGSMDKQRDFRTGVIGAVIFARADTPAWVTPLFRLTP